jgi:hypothetical protein
VRYIRIVAGQPEDYTLAQLRADNPNTSFPKVPSDETLAGFDIYPLQPVAPPAFNPVLQVLSEGTPTEGPSNVWTQTWVLTDRTDAEIAALQRELDVQQTTSPSALAAALEALTRTLVDTTTLDGLNDSDLASITNLYTGWIVGVDVAIGDFQKYEGNLYRCIQAHTTQAGWEPPNVPALWVRYREPAPGPQVWIAGEQVQVGTIRYWPTVNDTEYEAIQAHTTQVGWEPPNVPALWQAV